MALLDRALTWYAAARARVAAAVPPVQSVPGSPYRAPAYAPPVAAADEGIVLREQFAPARPAVDLEDTRLYATSDFREPSARTFLTWTPGDIRLAQRLADAGDLRMAADLCSAILGDDRANAVMNTRANAVLGSELTFEQGRGRKGGMAVRALEADEDWYEAFDESVLAQLLIWGRLLGIGLAQHKWREFADHGGRVIPVAEIYRARFLRFDEREDSWKVRFGNYGSEMPIDAGDGKWIIFTPYGKSRPWEHGLWRGMARLWLLKQFAIDDWGRHSEAHGKPMKVGIPPKAGDGANHGNKNLRAELAQDLAELGANSTLVLPPGFDFKLVEAEANTWQMFQAQINLADTAMSIMGIGTNLPTEVGNGAATGATAQNLVRIDYKRDDAAKLSTTTHDQSLVWWADFNYGNRGLAPWPIWDVIPPADIKAKAEVLRTFADAVDKLTEANVPVDIPALAEEYEVPLREVSESRVQSPRIFEYHLKYGVLTKNEIRTSLGYDPQAGGDVVPEPIVQVPGTRPTAAVPAGEALAALAAAHNAAHTDPARQTSVEALRAVWDRGATLASGADRDAWAMGRVTAFLQLLAEGEPEHPAYVADNDLLPDGHERRSTDA